MQKFELFFWIKTKNKYKKKEKITSKIESNIFCQIQKF